MVIISPLGIFALEAHTSSHVKLMRQASVDFNGNPKIPNTKFEANSSQAFVSSELSLSKMAIEFIKSPEAKHLSDMHPSTSDMKVGHLPVPGSATKIDIYCYPPDQDRFVSGSILANGAWENDGVKYCATPWLQNPTLKGNFLDVGGNIGAYTLPLGKFLEGKGEVISVEGMPDIAEHLKAGIVGNKLSNVDLFQYCVGAPDASDYVTMNLNPVNKGGSGVNGNKDATGTPQGPKVKVGLTTLDSMLESFPALKSVISMKVDIEGNEGRMLKGAHEFFSKHAPCYLQMELQPAWLTVAGTPFEEVMQTMAKFGYSHSKIDATNYRFEQNNITACLKRFA